MSKIIQFTSKNNNEESKWAEIIERKLTNANIAPEITKIYKEEVVTVLSKLNKIDSVSLSLPETITDEQTNSLKAALAAKDETGYKILKELLIAKIEICLLQHKIHNTN